MRNEKVWRLWPFPAKIRAADKGTDAGTSWTRHSGHNGGHLDEVGHRRRTGKSGRVLAELVAPAQDQTGNVDEAAILAALELAVCQQNGPIGTATPQRRVLDGCIMKTNADGTASKG